MLIITHQRLAKVNSFNIEAQDNKFDRVYKFKYLDVVIDSCLSWNDHIDYISAKMNLGLACCVRLERLFLMRHVLPYMMP